MQTARDYLVKANLAKPGRGKFSNDAKAYLNKAIAAGEKFSDWDENGRVVVSPVVKNKIEKRATPSIDEVSEPVIERKPVVFPKQVRYRNETEIVFTHPRWGNEIVLDSIGSTPVWAAEKIVIPSWLEGYDWKLR